MGHDKADGAEERVKNSTSPTLAPSANNRMQDSLDQPAPVRHGIQITRNQLPLGCQQAPDQLASGMHGLICVSVCIS